MDGTTLPDGSTPMSGIPAITGGPALSGGPVAYGAVTFNRGPSTVFMVGLGLALVAGWAVFKWFKRG